MPYDLTGRGLHPLGELIELAEFPLAEYLPADQISSVFDGLYYAEARSAFQDSNLVIDAWLAFEQELALQIPGTDAIALVLASAGAGWTAIHTEIVLGPGFALTLREITLGLRVSPDILRDVATGQGAEIEITADIRFDPSGVTITNFSGASLRPAYLCGTHVVVEAADVRPVFGDVDPPEFLQDPTFRGITFERLAVTLPPEYLETDPGAELVIAINNAAIGSTGFTGRVSIASADVAHPVTGTLAGFPFRFRHFSLDIEQNSLVDLSLGADLRLTAFEDGAEQKWVAVDFAFGQNGSFSGALAAAQPPEAGAGPGRLLGVEYQGVLSLGATSIRVTRVGDVWALYFSGTLEILIEGAVDWPEIVFDEIGVNSDLDILLPDGAGITFASPMVVNWHFVRLTITKFRFGYANDQGDRLQLALSAELLILEGLPAGASVDGLIVEWVPGSNARPDVSMTGIGIKFGVPGSFNASLYVSYVEADGAIEFRGKGSLELTSLDMAIDIGIIAGYQSENPPEFPHAFPYLYLIADAKLMPTGIPIGNTGLSIYGFSGLLAYNMALDVNRALPADERYYELFTRPPIGVTDVSKWIRDRGQNALGVGVLLGTQDKGYCLNVKGMLIVAFPDLTILLQAKANFLKQKSDLSTEQEGTLDALMVYASGQNTISLDILAHWGMPDIVTIDASARAFFSFSDPNAWYLEMGRDQAGKRAAAKALKWGGHWLFTGGSWFRLDNHGLVTGVLIDLDLSAKKGGFHVSVSGHARGEMKLFWEPAQWEGSLAMSGKIKAGYKRWSVGVSLNGNARGRVRRPFDVYVQVEACIDLLLDTICKEFEFDWSRSDGPTLEAPIRKWAAVPRDWTPHEEMVGGQPRVNTGVVAIGDDVPAIHPHSILTLDFAKPMVDVTGYFNEAVSLPDGGYLTIGSRSNWSARYRLDSITIVRDPGGPDEESIPVWGTWARETLQPNMTLRIFSSARFADDGSLSNGYLDGKDLDYCDTEPTDTVVCIPILGLKPGYGRIDDGPMYHWNKPDDTDSTGGDGEHPPGGSSDGIVLENGDTLTVVFPGPVGDVTVTTKPSAVTPPDKRPPSICARICRFLQCGLLAATALLLICVLGLIYFSLGHQRFPSALPLAFIAAAIALLLVLIAWACRCWCKVAYRPGESSPPAGSGIGKPGGTEVGGKPGGPDGGDNATGDGGTGSDDPGHGPGTTTTTTAVPSNGGVVVFTPDNTGGNAIAEICYEPGHGSPDWTEASDRGGLSTQNEDWTVPTLWKVFEAETEYELTVRYTATRKAPDGATNNPLGAPAVVSKRFTVLGPPSRPGALANYIASTYPFNGARPVYTGYDIRVRFNGDYMHDLYTSAGEQLVVRLFDGNGQPVEDENGNALLIPATEPGPVEPTIADIIWRGIYLENVLRGCPVGPPMATEQENTMVVAVGPGLVVLTRNSQYVAELVSSARPNIALASWGFTTSSYETFAELVSANRRILRPHTISAASAATDFDSLARALQVPTVAYVEQFSVTPLVLPAAAGCLGLLLEAPEPMDFNTRLTAVFGGLQATAIPNVDGTRAFLLRTNGGNWNLDLLSLGLTWQRDVGDALPRLTANGDASPETVTFDIDLRGP